MLELKTLQLEIFISLVSFKKYIKFKYKKNLNFLEHKSHTFFLEKLSKINLLAIDYEIVIDFFFFSKSIVIVPNLNDNTSLIFSILWYIN